MDCGRGLGCRVWAIEASTGPMFGYLDFGSRDRFKTCFDTSLFLCFRD